MGWKKSVGSSCSNRIVVERLKNCCCLLASCITFRFVTNDVSLVPDLWIYGATPQKNSVRCWISLNPDSRVKFFKTFLLTIIILTFYVPFVAYPLDSINSLFRFLKWQLSRINLDICSRVRHFKLNVTCISLKLNVVLLVVYLIMYLELL